ncbi:MAG: sterol desaturase family protein [Caulobacteraceae bacterium]
MAILLVATDLAQYWLHRAFHDPWLWPFHAIHHSASDVNWTTTFRTHRSTIWSSTPPSAYWPRPSGFSEMTLLLAAPIFFFSGAITHANLNWTFGPLRYVVASPVFHRWHHGADANCQARNFAPMFPVWDLMFGTFHMPPGQRPETFGADGVPEGLFGQLAHPLRGPGSFRVRRLGRLARKLRRFGQVGGRRRGLLIEAAIWLLLARIALLGIPFPTLARRLGAFVPAHRRAGDAGRAERFGARRRACGGDRLGHGARRAPRPVQGRLPAAGDGREDHAAPARRSQRAALRGRQGSEQADRRPCLAGRPPASK